MNTSIVCLGNVSANATGITTSGRPATETLLAEPLTGCPYQQAAQRAGAFDKVHQNVSWETIQDPGSSCPFRGNRISGVDGTGPTLDEWYPQRLRVEVLDIPSPKSNPYSKDKDFNYTKEFLSLDYWQLKKDLREWMTDSQAWWPADYGNYGPQMIRTTWHNAGTYRIADGRGGLGHGMQRFLPISSWLDNGNTDKTRRLLWPIKQKYGDKLSWADLMALAGNVALEQMGVHTVGFGGGRLDGWENDIATYWGPELEILGRSRWSAPFNGSISNTTNGTGPDLANPMGSSEMQLIYVNPEGPAGNSVPLDSAREIRETFSRMAMSDEETVALIAGGHTFGKSHGAVPQSYIGPPPENASIEYQGLGWINSYKSGNAEYTTTNGIEGSWTENPLVWNLEYLTNLLDLDWKLVQSPAGAHQWTPVTDNFTTPDAHIPNKRNPLMMMTSDIALKADPSYNKILKKFRNSNETVFFNAFSEAWYKLIHRDLGPKTRYLGPEVPTTDRIWQDPIPAVNHPLVNSTDIKMLKSMINNVTGLDNLAFARAAWAAASVHRTSDKRGGANGARIRFEPQINWEVNRPDELKTVISKLESIQSQFNAYQKNVTANATKPAKGKSDKKSKSKSKRKAKNHKHDAANSTNVTNAFNTSKAISLADLIVLAGTVDIENAAKKAGFDNVSVPFTPGRMDAHLNETDVASFEWLHPVMDGFRNFESGNFSIPSEKFLIDRAQLLGLSAPELTVLVGGMRALNLNWDGSNLGVLTNRPGTLSNDFFVNLVTMDTKWLPLDDAKTRFEGVDRATGEHRWYATRTDLIFGHHNQLRALSEVYGSSTGEQRFVSDFIDAWNKVMMLDRFDIDRNMQ